MTDHLERPNDEEYALLVQELRDANKEIFSLLHVQRMDATPIPGFEPATVGGILYGPKAPSRKVPWGVKFDKALAMSRARADATESALDDWTKREQAFMTASAPPTTDLSTPAE